MSRILKIFHFFHFCLSLKIIQVAFMVSFQNLRSILLINLRLLVGSLNFVIFTCHNEACITIEARMIETKILNHSHVSTALCHNFFNVMLSI
jgi:hypothetical protein